MAFITEIIGTSNNKNLLEDLINKDIINKNLFIKEKIDIQEINHDGNKHGFTFILALSTSRHIETDKILEKCKTHIECNYFQWINLNIIKEGGNIKSFYKGHW